jgi:hypothetical protein
VTDKHVPETRYFIQACLSKHSSEEAESVAVAHGLVTVGERHGAEFDESEGLAMKTRSDLEKKDRPAQVEENSQAHRHKHWQQDNQKNGSDYRINNSLESLIEKSGHRPRLALSKKIGDGVKHPINIRVGKY